MNANGMKVDCHFDEFDVLAYKAVGEKTFMLCTSDDLDCDLSANANINERHDIDHPLHPHALVASGPCHSAHIHTCTTLHIGHSDA